MSRRSALVVGLLAMATPAFAMQELRPVNPPNTTAGNNTTGTKTEGNRTEAKAVEADTTAVPIHRLVSLEDLTPPFVSELFDGDDTPDVIYAGAATYTNEDEPVIPDTLRRDVFTEDGAFVPGWFVVHFERAIEPADKEWLDQLTQPITRQDGSALSRWYIPNNAMIAYVGDAATYASIEGADPIDFVGPYHPAYKIDPRIGSIALTSPHRVGRSLLQLNIDLIPGADPELVQSGLTRAGATVLNQVHDRGLKTYDVHFVVVSCSPTLLPRLAQIEGVRMIQESGDGLAKHDLSGGGKLQNRQLVNDDGSNSPVVNASAFPLWVTHNLQGQGQMIGVVDSSMDWNNVGTSGCGFGYPDLAINNYGFALPNLSSLLLGSVGSGGVNLKIPRSDLLGGATLLGVDANEHGSGVAGAALADFYGNNDNKWWEHDPDTWDSWAPTNYSGLLGPGIAHEAQLYFTPVMDSNNGFRWESPGEFPSHMGTTLTNMANAGVSTTNHSVGLAEASNTYTQTTVVHDTKGYDHPDMLQCMAAGNSGAGSNRLTSQSVAKNVLCVGASDDVLKPEDRVTFSSTGPSFDNRIKPDVMAPGHDTFGRAGGVASALILPNTNGSSSASCAYQYTQGTSFSSPIMAGAGALIHQFFEEGRYTGSQSILDPSAALLKAALVNAGHRLTGANLGDNTYPNMYQGWGEPNLSEVLDFGSGSRRLIAHDVPSAAGFNSASSSNDSYTISVNNAGQGLKVSLAWTDEPGSSGVGKKLINDLDLRVTSPGGTVYRGNVFNGSAGVSTSGGSADTLNNVENVILASPSTGNWTITVDPGAGNYAAGQGYALVITGDVTEGGGTPAPSADFSGTPTSGNSPLAVSFTNLTTGSATSYAWTFGDGGTSTSTNPSHTYTTAGSYTVSLTATGPGGSDAETKSGYITVSAPPVPPTAEFSGTPTSGNSPLVVNFTNLTTGSATSYSWTFGDGGTSTATNPGHTYTSAGTYTVSLTATGPGGSDVETKVGYITVSTPPAPPSADFSGTPTSGNAPLVVSFANLTTGSVSSYSWTFGDGGTSTATNPSHTYTSAGTYTVQLTATGPGGSDVATKVGYITVGTAPTPPTADFSGTPTSGTVPLVVNFTDLSSGSISTYAWTFGDGGTSSSSNPSHTYTATGTYNVSLTVTGPGGSDAETKNGYITVSSAPTPPTAGFSGTPTSGTAPLVVNFSDSSSGSISSYAWTFGDGGTSTAANPSHTYTSAGTYDVSLTVTGPGGSDVDTKVGYITVDDPPAGGELYYMSFLSTTSVPGLGNVRDEDVVTYDPATGQWAMYFDGSDVGLGSTDLNAIHILDDGTLIFSINASSFSIPGLVGGPSGTTVEDSDLVMFSFTSSGANTAGSMQFVFDGSDVGLTTNGEDIDGVYEFPGGGLAISTLGSAGVSGVSGVRDEDIMLFNATQFGSATTGTWSMYFDGSDVGFAASSGHDLNAISFENGADLLFSTAGTYGAAGGSGADEDLSRFVGTFGASTSGTASLILDLSALGISTSEDIDGICFK